MNIIQQAKEFAIKAHGNQKYSKMPYEYHLQQVVSKLTHWRDLGQWNITDEMLAADGEGYYSSNVFGEYDTEEEAVQAVKEQLTYSSHIPNKLVLVKVLNISWEDRE